MKNLNNEKGYRYGFNGKESDVDFGNGDGNVYDYGFRIYNAQIAKFLSVDPLTKSYPWYTPYQFAGNKPIWAIDLDGLEEVFYTENIQKSIAFKHTYYTVRVTEKGKEFQKALKSQNKFNVLYVDFDATAAGVCSRYKTFKEFKRRAYGNVYLSDVEESIIKKAFENDTKEVIVIGLSELYKVKYAFKDGLTQDKKDANLVVSATLQHEEMAHAIRYFYGTKKDQKVEHFDYHGRSSTSSPTIEEILTLRIHRNTKAYESLQQLKKIIDLKF